jgi:hypothetical protein
MQQGRQLRRGAGDELQHVRDKTPQVKALADAKAQDNDRKA